MSDHKRGCAGREYVCTCGHDDRFDWQTMETYAGFKAVLVRTERGFVVSAFKDVTGCWHMTSRDSRGAHKLKVIPTHWMPLPEPPK